MIQCHIKKCSQIQTKITETENQICIHNWEEWGCAQEGVFISRLQQMCIRVTSGTRNIYSRGKKLFVTIQLILKINVFVDP